MGDDLECALSTLGALIAWGTTDNAPTEMILVGLSPSGLRSQRRASGRSALESALFSLQCREIRSNPFLKERLSRQVLSGAPDSADQLVGAIFSRLYADAMHDQVPPEGRTGRRIAYPRPVPSRRDALLRDAAQIAGKRMRQKISAGQSRNRCRAAISSTGRNLQNRTGFALRFVFVLHPIPF